jgi:alkylation response protein AidB-like acyl-CoA dehydrogenase
MIGPWAGQPDGAGRREAGVSAEQRAGEDLLKAVRDFVEGEVKPSVGKLDLDDEYPRAHVDRMKELGLFGVLIPQEYGGLGLWLEDYARIMIELSRGWMSLAGILNSHLVSAWMIERFGTEQQKTRHLPPMATGEARAAISMTEPQGGSDLQAITTRATREGEAFSIEGEKMWCTNGLHASIIMLLTKNDPEAVPRHRGMTTFVVQKQPGVHQQPGLEIPPLLEKLGYRGLEGTRLSWKGFRAPVTSVLGGEEGIGLGFKQFMAGIEVGRINVAARGVGIALASYEAAMDWARARTTFGKPIAQHQLIGAKLADIATKIRASYLLTLEAARKKDAGERADLDAGAAKLFATELAQEAVLESMRIHGGAGYLQDAAVARFYRDSPVLVIGEGSNEIQRIVIARRLVELAESGGSLI